MMTTMRLPLRTSFGLYKASYCIYTSHFILKTVRRAKVQCQDSQSVHKGLQFLIYNIV